MRPGAEVQDDSFGAEHTFRFLLAVGVFLLSVGAVKDPGKVHVEKDLGKIVDNRSIRGECKIPAMQPVHDLIEQGIVILIHLNADLTFFRSRTG